MQRLIGSTISHYSVEDRLGEGGMGEVFLARDLSLDRRVALKFLPPSMAEDPLARKRFLWEARTLASLNHPFICKIFEAGEADGREFLAMEYVEGETLESRLRRGRLPLELALRVIAEALEGLDAAHTAGIIHRDLKPSNLMLTRDGHISILDFGLASRFVSQQDDTLTSVSLPGGGVTGTLVYMSPEQAEGRPIDVRSDIFSLGVVCYEMLTGVHPFRRDTTVATALAIVRESPPPLSRHVEGIPDALEGLLRSLLAKAAADRFQSVGEVRQRLELIATARYAAPADSEETLTPSGRRRRPAPGLAAAPAIAVLPFANVSPEAEGGYFSDGLTEELITTLMGVGGLRVASRTSVFGLRDRAESVQSLGRTLNVDYILEGSVRKFGDRVRITSQLIDTSDGYQEWSEQFDGRLEDIFQVQEDIARAIVEKLKVSLGTERGALVKRFTDDIEAYQLYLKGRYYWNRRSPVDLEQAHKCFEAALQRDDRYALAYAGLADYYTLIAGYGFSPPAEVFPKAKEMSLKALELDAGIADAHIALGTIHLFYDWDWEGANREYRVASSLAPSSVEALLGRVFYLMVTERLDEALAEAEKALQLDPIYVPTNVYRAMIRLYQGDSEGALAVSESFREMAAHSMELYYVMGLAHQLLGNRDEALGLFGSASEISQQHPLLLAWLGACHAHFGESGAARDILEQLDKAARQGYVQPLTRAIVHAGLGEDDVAIRWLEKAADARDPLVVYLQVMPTFARLRSHTGWAPLIRKMGLDRMALGGTSPSSVR